ncbi:hypothetical protein [Pseudomonas protegens]|uniref:hypothetical protein n=1 Tax=Pseudomonas protegens TaxID=380021 RepID=UPI001CDA6EC8|nr:hypothetical protein [Pseudomonas protegens]
MHTTTAPTSSDFFNSPSAVISAPPFDSQKSLRNWAFSSLSAMDEAWAKGASARPMTAAISTLERFMIDSLSGYDWLHPMSPRRFFS